MKQNGIGSLIDRAMAQPQHAQFWENTPPKPAMALTREQAAAAQIMNDVMVLLRFRQFPAAVAPLMKACDLWPTNADILFQAGGVLLEVGRPDLALAKFDSALALRPRWSDCHNNRSAALARMGDTEGAIAAAHAAIETGTNVAALANLCAAYSGKGDNEKALGYGQQAVQLSQGTNAMALINYGVALRSSWALDEAAGAQERAIQVNEKAGAQDHMAWSNLGAIKNLQGKNHEALAVTQRAAEIAPSLATVRSNMVMFSDLLPETTLIESLCMRRTWAHLYEAPMKRFWKVHKNDRDPNRRLKVGYVGADFRQHSAAHIHGAVIRAHDPEQVAVYVYAGNQYEDEVSARIREAPALVEWVTTSRMSDTDLASRIYQDQIDVLVDVAGFTSGGRLPTFACKPAPIQACGWGYATGTGLDAMDVFLADNVMVPPELEYGYHETVVRLPNLLCFDPMIDLPPPGPPPRTKNGYVTFGSYNRVEKISRPILELWCRVMREITDSQIILKFGGLEGQTADQLKDAFEHFGVSRDRVETRGHTPRDEHLAQYSDIDLMLDTWPHVGGITTLEGLMMGVPCVTLLGDRAPSRVSASILTTLGMTDFIASTPDQYVDIAKEQAGADLTALRAALPDIVKSSWIGDVPRYTRHYEEVLRELWRAWCAKVAPEQVAS